MVGEIDQEYYYIHSDSPLKNFNDNEYKTSLNMSPGKECKTFGDIIAFFDGNIDINFENTRKQAGNSKDRAFSEDFSRKYHKSFIFLISKSLVWLKDLTNIIYPGKPNELFQAVLKNGDSSTRTSDHEMKDIKNKLREIYRTTRQRSVEKRVVGAVIEEIFPSDKEIGLSSALVTQRQSDYKQIMERKSLNDTIVYQNRRKKKDDLVIENVVNFILQTNNIQILSWGYHIVKLDRYEKVVLPNHVRMSTKGDLWNDYDNANKSREKSDRIGFQILC